MDAALFLGLIRAKFTLTEIRDNGIEPPVRGLYFFAAAGQNEVKVSLTHVTHAICRLLLQVI